MGKRAWKHVQTPWDGEPGFWAALNRFFFLFEGPAQIGTRKPERPITPPAEQSCPLCGQLMSAHVIARGGPGERTFVHCPTSAAA